MVSLAAYSIMTNMKNDYRAVTPTEIAILVWDYRAQVTRDCLIDAADFPLVLSFNGTWYAQKVRGLKQKWYAQMKAWDGSTSRTILMHRIIMGLTDPLIEVDHRDNDGLNNRRINLRECSHIENARYRQPNKDWGAYDAAHEVAEEYRLERSIASRIEVEYELTRQALWYIRRFKTKTSKAAIAYRDACDEAKCRPYWRITQDHPVDGKKFGAVRVISEAPQSH